MTRSLAALLGAVTAALTLAGCSFSGDDGGRGSTKGPTVVTEIVLRPGQTEVTGTVTSLSAKGAVAAPLPTPFTITVPVRGEGGATISGAIVGGRPSTVVWDGGRPLPVTGSGSLDIGPAPIEVTATGIRWLLEGAPRVFTTGSYRLGATVAVGARGLAAPRDGVTFDSNGRTALVSRGGARIELPPSALELEGPGTVELKGRLQLRTSEDSGSATVARFGEAPFRVRLTPTSGGYQVDALFQGGRAG